MSQLIQSQLLQSFYKVHDNQKHFKFGQEIVLEKKKDRTSKVLQRRVRLMEDGFHQSNNKIIPYPSGFNIITKNQFQQLSQQEKDILPWTVNPQSIVRVFFCRQANAMNKTLSSQFQKPTAVYFPDLETGQRFIEFLKFRDFKRQNLLNQFRKVEKKWLQKIVGKVMGEALKNLNKLSNQHNYIKQQKYDKIRQCQEIMNFDQKYYKEMLQKMQRNAKVKEEEQILQFKQQQAERMLYFVPLLSSVGEVQVKNLIHLWRTRSLKFFEQKEREEEEEQRRIQELQQQLDNNKQIDIPDHIFPDFHLHRFRLVMDPQISLAKPYLYLVYECNQAGKVILTGEQLFNSQKEHIFSLAMDENGWHVEMSLLIKGFSLKDSFTFRIYDEYRDINEQRYNQIMDAEGQVQAYLAQSNMILEGQVRTFEIQKNLHNSRRHFLKLDISNEFSKEFFQDQQKNNPMLQFDIYESSSQQQFDIQRQLQNDGVFINQYYSDIIRIPNNVGYIPSKQQVKYIEQALLIRGQILANQKWSQEYLKESQECLKDIQVSQVELHHLFNAQEEQHKYDDLCQYFMGEGYEDIIVQNLIKCSLRGFQYETRLHFFPVLMKTQQKLQILQQQYQIGQPLYKQFPHQNEHLQKVSTYLKYVTSFPTNIFSDQFRKQLLSYTDEINEIYSACYAIDKNTSLPLLVRVYQMLEQQHKNFGEAAFAIMQSLKFEPQLPYITGETYLAKYMSNFFADFFYLDAWLRVVDYVMCIGYICDGQYSKALASIIGGILRSHEFKYKTNEEFDIQLRIYGQLLCDPDTLITNSYECFQNDQFYILTQNDNLRKLANQQGNVLEPLLRQQRRIEPVIDELQECLIDIPEEHENSIYREMDINCDEDIRSTAMQFIHKDPPKVIHIYIHKVNLHLTSFEDPAMEISYNQQKFINENYIIVQYEHSNLIHINMNGKQKFSCTININNYIPNQICRVNQILQDNYILERDYQVSEIDFSIYIESNSQYKQSNLNLTQFKEIIQNYFNLQGINFGYQQCYRDLCIDQELHLVDFLAQYILSYDLNSQYLYEVLSLFSPLRCQGVYLKQFREIINQYYLSRGLQQDDYLSYLGKYEVKFLKVVILDQNYELIVNLTIEFNQYLKQEMLRTGTYDIQYPSLLQLWKPEARVQRDKMYLRMKYISFGRISKKVLNIDQNYNIINFNSIDQNNIEDNELLNKMKQPILNLDSHRLMNYNEIDEAMSQLPLMNGLYFKNIQDKSIWFYLRYRNGAKQLIEADIEGCVRDKTKQIKYYLIKWNDKRLVVMKNDVKHNIEYDELQEVRKPWRQQSFHSQYSYQLQQ